MIIALGTVTLLAGIVVMALSVLRGGEVYVPIYMLESKDFGAVREMLASSRFDVQMAFVVGCLLLLAGLIIVWWRAVGRLEKVLRGVFAGIIALAGAGLAVTAWSARGEAGLRENAGSPYNEAYAEVFRETLAMSAGIIAAVIGVALFALAMVNVPAVKVAEDDARPTGKGEQA